jgi:hypothetical protein
VVGLSVAAGLVNTCGKDKTTFLVERREQVSIRRDYESSGELGADGVARPRDDVSLTR